MGGHYQQIAKGTASLSLFSALIGIDPADIQEAIVIFRTQDGFRVRSTECCAYHTTEELEGVIMSIHDALRRQHEEDSRKAEAN